MASSGAGAASKESGAEEVVDVDTAGAQVQTKDAAPEPAELDHPIEVLDTKYPFQMSTYDAALFIGHKSIGCAGSAAMVIIVFATVAIQGGFCWIAYAKLANSQYGDTVTQNMKWWRVDAHLDRYGLGGVSLVERVCNSDPTLMTGTDIKAKISMIKDYIPEFADSVIASGPVMVLLALAIWYASLSKELHNILNFSMAVVSVPKGPRTRLTKCDDGGVELAALGKTRIVIAAFIVMVRLTIASVLCYVGTLRTAYTTNWGGILLNAIKLNFIAGVSDVLFASVMPENVKALFKKLKPLNKPRVRTWKGMDNWSCIALILIPAGLACAYFLVIEPEISHQLDAYNVLCRGDRTFLHKDHHHLVIWLNGDSYKKRDPATSMLYASTEEIIELNGAAPSGLLLGLEAPSLHHFEAYLQEGPSELSGPANPECKDVLDIDPDAPQAYMYQIRHVDYFRKSTGNQSISSCGDVAPYCTTGFAGGVYQLPTIHARRFCPVTCGCHLPGVLLDDRYCPGMYCTQLPPFIEARASRQCVDTGAADLAGSAEWQSLVRQQGEIVDSLPTEFRGRASAAGLLSIATPASADAVSAAQNLSLVGTHEFLMLELGCDYADLGRTLAWSLGGQWGDPCQSDAMKHHCPITCWCNMGMVIQTGCPPLCPGR